MGEESKVPAARWAWSNVTGDIYCDQDKCTIRINLPKVRREHIAFEVTEETFCLKSSKDGDNPLDYFGCWILTIPIDPKKAKATFENDVLTVTAPLAKPSRIIKVPIESRQTLSER